MTIEELAKEYEQQADVLKRRIDGLCPLPRVYQGTDLYMLRKRIKILYDMYVECKNTAELLKGYYDE